MSIIPLGVDDIQSKAENAARIRLENMYLIDSPYSPDGISRVSRPTLTQITTIGNGPIWGMFQDDGVLDGDWLVVSANSLYRYDGTNSFFIMTIPGTGFCQFAGGSDSTGSRVIVLRDGKAFSTDGSNGVQIIMPDGEPIGSVTYIDSYFFLSVQNTNTEIGRFYWISPGLTNPDPLDFATAERLPDQLVSVNVIGDELWMLGQTSIEVWTASGNADSPFQRVPGRAYTYGCKDRNTTVQMNYKGYPCLLWVTDKNIVAMAQGSPNRVSNDSVEEILRTATNLRAWGFQFNRHDFYVLTCDQATFAYDLTKQTWSRWSSYNVETWRAHLGIQSDSQAYAGDAVTNQIYSLVEGDDDAGDPVIRTVSGLVLIQNNFTPCTRVNVLMNAGWTSDYGDPANLEIRWSDDLGYSWGPYMPMSIGQTGQYSTGVSISGLGMMRRPGRLFQFRFTEKSRFRIDYATMNEM